MKKVEFKEKRLHVKLFYLPLPHTLQKMIYSRSPPLYPQAALTAFKSRGGHTGHMGVCMWQRESLMLCH